MPPRAFFLSSTESLDNEGMPQASGFREWKSCLSLNCSISITLDLGIVPGCK